MQQDKMMVTLDGYRVRHVTVKAICIVKGDNEPIWLPRSLCQDGDLIGIGDFDIIVEEWLADDRELDY
jgi:hypothetical protein